MSDKLKQELLNDIDVITRYPERNYKTLRSAIGEYVGVTPDNIIVGNGSTELISGTIKAISPKDAILLAPSYSEYEREVGLNGGNIRYFPLSRELDWLVNVEALSDFIKDDTRLIIICNPNNPTGNALSVETISDILEISLKRNITVMIDETYIEFGIDISDYEAIPLTDRYPNLVVLRGVSKFYAAPGLRLGYAVTSSDKIKSAILKSKDPWSINSLAERAGILMFNDTEYQRRVREYIKREMTDFKNKLEDTGKFKFYPSKANFYMIELINTDKTSTEVFEYCIRNYFMIRDLSSFAYLSDKYIRVCMAEHDDNVRLAKALIEYV